MNIWKIATLTLTVGMAIVVSKDAVRSAHAAAPPAETSQGIAWDWGMEQPHMQRALADLRAARHSLEAAGEHKGGWRALALKHTDEAIAETVRGIEYGKGHPHE